LKISARHIELFRTKILLCDISGIEKFLENAEAFQFGNSTDLVGFHEALLLLEAYPASASLYERANNLLRNFEVLTRRFLRKHKKAAEQLVNSGLRGTEVHGAFTFPSLLALRKQYPAYLFLHSFDKGGAEIGSVLKHFLPAVEFEAVNAENDRDELLNDIFGKGDHLVHIIDSFHSHNVPPLLRDQLFDDLKIFSGIILDGKIPDRSTARGIIRKPFIHSEIQKRAEPLEVISRVLPAPENLTKAQEESIILNSLCMLATLNRETDPVSSCAPRGVTLFQLERGISIALFSMDSDRRMPLESYIGYMLFKNGVPHAYGGSWIFGNRALFGINIFEPFRGGESSLTILQLLRVYHQYYGVTAFSVEPYQFGKDNPEGIASGAYWFYYKMGFRSDDKKLAGIAEKEFAKMQKVKSYRSSRATLKKFAESRVTWNINPRVELLPDPSEISRGVTDFVKKKYAGNRAAAVADLRKKIGEDAEGISDDYLLAFLSFNHHQLFPLLLPEQVKELWLMKQTDERRYNDILSSLLAVNQ
jgi:hypothetical protein